MKSTKKKVLMSISFFSIIIIIAICMFVRTIKRPLKTDKSIVLTVNEGESFYYLLNKLSDNDEVRNINFIKIYLKLINKELDIKPGEYELSKEMSIGDIVDTLNTESTRNMSKFTVPEGYNIDEIAKKLQEEGFCTTEQFIEAVKEYPLPKFVKSDENKRYNLEGYLFPDTYIINKESSPSEIIEIMISRFKEMWNTALSDTNKTINENDIEKIITVASMIEKEARLDKERPIIASVINNRINKNMKLQIDATVIYSLGKHVELVTYDHLKTKSPYNTYENYGLPIGPISNPGIESIKAALEPVSTDYLFYVLQKDMTHYFTDNYDDFLKKQEELGYFD